MGTGLGLQGFRAQGLQLVLVPLVWESGFEGPRG